MIKFIRQPGPGEFRGEGTWERVNDATKANWELLSKSGFLPVARSMPVPEKVRDHRNVEPNFVLADGWLIHQFHELAVPVVGTGDRALQYAHDQLKSLIKQVIVDV